MEEKNRPQRRKPKKEKGDWFLTVSLVQIAFCAFFCLIVFVCIKTNADARESLRADFSALMNWSLEREDVQEVAALVREYFTSSGESVPVFGGFTYDVDAAETTVALPETTVPTSAAPQTQEAEKETTTAPSTTEPQKEKKEKKETSDGAGGEDVTALSAKENTSFSPTAVTVPIVRPVRGGRYSSKFTPRITDKSALSAKTAAPESISFCAMMTLWRPFTVIAAASTLPRAIRWTPAM